MKLGDMTGTILELAQSLGFPESRITRFEGSPVLITALPYGRGKTAVEDSIRPVASIAPFAQKNFYRECTERLKGLLRAVPDAGGRVFCNSRLPEKKIALRSGLGSLGKNSLVLLPGKGSLFVLGGIVFSPGARFTPPDSSAGVPVPGLACGPCRACMTACPTGAITEPGRVDRCRCIQGLASEALPLPPAFLEKWGTVLYGCRICQDVCPLNRGAPPPAETAFGDIGPSVEISRILSFTDEGLRKGLFKGTALDMGWISPAALKRNAITAAAHQNAEGLLPVLKEYENHPHPAVSGAARWAVRRIRSNGTGR